MYSLSACLLVIGLLGAGTEPATSESTLDPMPKPSIEINAPADVRAKATGLNVTLRWTHDLDDQVDFVIERAKKGARDLSFALVAEVGPNTTVFEDALPSDGTYLYRILAVDSATGAKSEFTESDPVEAKRDAR